MSPVASPEASPAATPARISIPDRILTIVVVLAYIVLQIALAVAHDPWRDEAQAWLWAQSLATPMEFFAIPGEGHPPLWYWLLRGLSLVTDFNHARYFSTLVAIGNAILLARLLRGELLLLIVLLFSHVVAQSWGHNFRPYGLVLTAVLGAMLLQRQGRPIAATWVMALSCGLHFFAGFLFGFWLLHQLHRGTRLSALVGPALLGMLFGVSALVSGMGNPEGVPASTGVFKLIAYNLAWPMTWPDLRLWPAAVLTVALLCYGLWRDKFTLISLLALTTVFAVGSAVVYGQSPWHSAFMMMLAVMAFLFAGPAARRWVLVVLLLPQVVAGTVVSAVRLGDPIWSKPDLYAVIAADAGPSFDPSRQLIAWQDFNLSTAAAIHGITYISGNNGERLGPVDWRRRTEYAVDPVLTTTPRPYWLVCGKCARALSVIMTAGLHPSRLASTVIADDGPLSAYRID
ncbi:hypothetical protein [Devosia sp. FKR38]|uniref:hypothetical protein n=1 Tax=Devosia sp. FKR38 TaxID=2562312 RepID=UPI0010C141AA|nr:hypothetical protein [Devosia sp. FKR38]